MSHTNISIATSAMLAEISVSCWTAKKVAKKETEELTDAKSASKRAAQVHKNLLSDDARLERINKYAAEIRNWVSRVTTPWSDTGVRLVTTKQFFAFKQGLDAHAQHFNSLVDDFVQMYPTLISAQAFKLGTMFSRDEYPSPDEVASKFGMRYAFMPVPESGDFRVDIADDIAADLKAQYDKEYNDRLARVQGDLWARLKDTLDKMSDRLGCEADGKNRIFRDSLVDNALELCDLLADLNVTGDADLEEARRQTAIALRGITAQELRKNEDIRKDVKSQVDDIRSKFAF